MNSISRRTFLAGSAGAAALALTACGGSGSSDASGDKTYKIGVLQLTQHAALDAANEGFVGALDASGIKYTIDQQNANNDQSACATIASKLVGDGDDLIFAIATPAAQAMAAATSDIPIVGSAITDYAASGL
ncbi:ABC transporter substrate binding protein, partial [Parolsenella catena]|uniref:ABC transporter substrate binding protein n=1 Tax=Parolsenella catena TaxID=2003188 RepID=UPI003AEF34E9